MTLSRAEMRAAREQLARREPHNAHDVSYLRVAVLAAHAREHGYDERLAAQAFEVFLAARNEVDIFPDVAPALARLGRRYALASLSNGNADLARIGLEDTFAVSLNARQIGAAKPERRCFERLAQELLLPTAAIAYVGDDPQLDVAAAQAAGLRTIWMNRRALPWPDDLPPADLVVSDCVQLAAALHT
jgi:putative hydrolase of the HAD superfamily